jgi:hypothetical protein
VSKKDRITRILNSCKNILDSYEPVIADFWKIIGKSLEKSLEDYKISDVENSCLLVKVRLVEAMIRDMKILLRKDYVMKLSSVFENEFLNLKRRYEKKWLKAEKGMVDILNFVEAHLYQV